VTLVRISLLRQDFQLNTQHIRHLPEVLDSLVQGLEGIADVGSQQFWSMLTVKSPIIVSCHMSQWTTVTQRGSCRG